MRILAFYPYLPYPLDRGAHHRGFHLLKSLAGEHEVDLVALAEKGCAREHTPVFEAFCRSVTVIPFEHPAWEKLFPKRLLNPLPSTIAHWSLPHAQNKLQGILAKNDSDAAHLFDAVLAQYFLQHHTQIPLVLDRTRVDLQYQLMERKCMRFSFKTRLLNLENLLKLWKYERILARRCSLQVVCGPDDESFIRRVINPRVKIAVIPNGVDITYFSPLSAPGEPRNSHPTLLFCGAMDYNPNIDALRWYFAQMHNHLLKEIPNFQLLLVGKDPIPEVRAYSNRPGVIVTGGVPDVRPYYRRAWLQIVPLKIGGGTRLKIVESMAMGTPVISTTIGAQGLGLQHRHDILLADDTQSFLRETIAALRDSSLRSSLETRGLHTVRSRLAWPSLGRQLCQAYAQLFQLPSIMDVPAPARSV